MSTREHLYGVVATLQPVIYGVSETELAASTPCTDFDVRKVINHMLGTIEAMRRVGASQPLDPQDPWGTHGDHMEESWQDQLSRELRDYADAWSQPEAWEGEAMDGAVTRQQIGDMGFVEVMLHGWDLAKGTGQDVRYDAEAAERALQIMDEIGETGRSQGAFGPEVQVSDDAQPFEKALGLSGRDPKWSAT